MKVEKRGIRITELPGDWTIETREDGMVDFGSSPYTMGEIREIRDALNIVLGEGDKGPWDRIEDVPAYVQNVIDKDGDTWNRLPEDRPGYFAGQTFAYLNHYAPFRRA